MNIKKYFLFILLVIFSSLKAFSQSAGIYGGGNGSGGGTVRGSTFTYFSLPASTNLFAGSTGSGTQATFKLPRLYFPIPIPQIISGGGSGGGSHTTTQSLLNSTARLASSAFTGGGAGGGASASNNTALQVFSCLGTDPYKNWTNVQTFDESGNLVSESRSFSDNLGRELQTQTANVVEGKIFASTTVYDALGNAVIQTLPAPITDLCFAYKDNFITPQNSTLPYSSDHFDKDITNSSSPALGEVFNPIPVSSTSIVGSYYSNTSPENYVATTNFPYSRIWNGRIGNISKAASPGNQLNMGSTHEGTSVTMPILWELNHYLQLRKHYVSPSVAGTDIISDFRLQGTKSITKDQNGAESVSFYDQEGKLLASCITGQETITEENSNYPGIAKLTLFGSEVNSETNGYLYIKPIIDGQNILTKNIRIKIVGGADVYNGPISTFNANISDNTYHALDPFRAAFKNADLEFYSYETDFKIFFYNAELNYLSDQDVAAGVPFRSNLPSTDDLQPEVIILKPDATGLLPLVTNSPYIINTGGMNYCTGSYNQNNILTPIPHYLTNNIYDFDLILDPCNSCCRSFTANKASAIIYNNSRNQPYNLTDPTADNYYIFERESKWDGVFYNYLDVHITKGSQSTFKIESLGNVQVIDLDNGLKIYEGTPNGGTTNGSPNGINPLPNNTDSQIDLRPSGYYRIIATTGNWFDVNNNFKYSNFTYYYYDDAGNLKAIVPPKAIDLTSTDKPAMATEYAYNTLGQTLSATSFDEGKMEFYYRKDGSLIYSQNGKQRDENKFSYVNYDTKGNSIESGEYTTNTGTFFQNMAGLPLAGPNGSTSTLSQIQQYADAWNESAMNNGTALLYPFQSQGDFNTVLYDLPDAELTTLSPPYNYTQRFLNGRISKTSNKNNTTWYSYNEDGQVEWMMQRIIIPAYIDQGISVAACTLGIKTVHYTYRNGDLVQSIYQKDATDLTEQFYHKYKYDNRGRLTIVYTRSGLETNLGTRAVYKYYQHGPLKRLELGTNLQGIDYVYTVNGWLKGINNSDLIPAHDPGKDGVTSSFTADIFGMNLDYFDNDFSSKEGDISNTAGLVGFTSYYGGNIRNAYWQTKDHGITSAGAPGNNPCIYAYKYDTKYQLTDAKFGYKNLSATSPCFAGLSGLLYDIENITYDKNDNKISDKRNGGFPTQFQYIPNTNQLTSALLKYDENAYLIEYDKIGQMTKFSTDEYQVYHNFFMDYDAAGMVTAVYHDVNKTIPIVKFLYNERRERIRKTSYSSSSPYSAETYTWYVRDGNGNILGIYSSDLTSTGANVLKEVSFYGTGRLGTCLINGNQPGQIEYDYELKDYQGNVRATITKNTDPLTAATNPVLTLSWADYNPNGALLPGRNSASSPKYRNGYQGEFAEKDEETGWDNFDLRMYNSELGIWFASDPYGQYHSPYLAMGNNPVNQVDPDGGWSWPGAGAGAIAGAATGAAIGLLFDKDNWGYYALGMGTLGFLAGGNFGPTKITTQGNGSKAGNLDIDVKWGKGGSLNSKLASAINAGYVAEKLFGGANGATGSHTSGTIGYSRGGGTQGLRGSPILTYKIMFVESSLEFANKTEARKTFQRIRNLQVRNRGMGVQLTTVTPAFADGLYIEELKKLFKGRTEQVLRGIRDAGFDGFPTLNPIRWNPGRPGDGIKIIPGVEIRLGN